MKVITPTQYAYIILLVVLSLQACNRQPSNDGVAKSQMSSNSYTSDKEGWLDNLKEAQAQSVKEHKPILASFTASDTCGLCEKLNTDVFSTSTFKAWAKKNVVLLEVDFPEKNQLPENSIEQNVAMARSLKVNSYPTIWILNITHEPENNRFKVKPMGKIGYQETPEKFIGLLQNLTRK